MLATACDSGSNDSNIKVVINTPTEVSLGMYGEEVTIDYNILGIEDVLASVTLSDESWLRIKEHSGRSVVITVADNESGASRMAAVTLSYGNSSATTIINQSGEAKAPIITSLSGEEMEIERAGSKVEIKYSLEFKNSTDYIYVKTSADWIYSIDTKTDGVVELGVATNTTKALRSTVITVGYGSASFNITLNQKGDGNMVFNAPILYGEYLGDALTPGAGNYWIILSDRGFNEEDKALPNATYYRIDAYGEAYYNGDSMVPIANGTYTFDKENTYAKGTFTAEYSGHWVTNKDGRREGDIISFESGTMVVENGKITLDVVIDGENHHVVYSGNTTIEDAQGTVNYYSTLRDDLETDLSEHSLIYACEGDYYDFGYTNWMFIITPNDGSGDCFQFDIITGNKKEEDGFIGDYKASDFLAKWSFIPGWTNQAQLLCSWYFTADQEDMAPFRDGTMSVKDNGDGTVTVDIDVVDDRRNRITGTWTGIPVDFSTLE